MQTLPGVLKNFLPRLRHIHPKLQRRICQQVNLPARIRREVISMKVLRIEAVQQAGDVVVAG